MNTSLSALVVVLLAATVTTFPLCKPTDGIKICRIDFPHRWFPGSHSTTPIASALVPFNSTEARLAFSGAIAKAPPSRNLSENLGGLPRPWSERAIPGIGGLGNLKARADPIWPHGLVVLDYHHDDEPVSLHVNTRAIRPPYGAPINSWEAHELRELIWKLKVYAHNDRQTPLIRPRAFEIGRNPFHNQRALTVRLTGGSHGGDIPKDAAMAVANFIGGLMFECVSDGKPNLIETGIVMFGTRKHPGMGSLEVWVHEPYQSLGNTTTF